MATKSTTTAKTTATAEKPEAAKTEATTNPAEAGNASPEETKRQEEEQARERAETAERAAEAADAQREDIAAGGSGELSAEDAELARVGGTITDPGAAPVDYSVQQARKPMHRLVTPEAASGEAMPREPVVALPYGSEPRGFDPATGEVTGAPVFAVEPPVTVGAVAAEDADA